MYFKKNIIAKNCNKFIFFLKINLGYFFIKNVFIKKKYFYFVYNFLKFKFFFKNKLLNYYDYYLFFFYFNLNYNGFSLISILHFIKKFFFYYNKSILCEIINFNFIFIKSSKKLLV